MSNVKRFEALRSEPLEDTLARLISKYSLGQVVWFDFWPVATVESRVQGQYTVPALQIVLGTPGLVLGPHNCLYYFIATPLIPDEAALEKKISEGLEHLRAQRAAQLNHGK